MKTTETSKTLPMLNTCLEAVKNMLPAMPDMFSHVELLVRLLLVNPASSATAEWSFSSLRRLKTYLLATCGHMRLNNLAFCHIHGGRKSEGSCAPNFRPEGLTVDRVL